MTLEATITKAVAGAALLDRQGRASDAQLARTLGVRRGMVHRWRNYATPRPRNLARLQALAALHDEADSARARAEAKIAAAKARAAAALGRSA